MYIVDVKMANMYTLRIDAGESVTREQVCSFLSKMPKITSYLMCYEIAEKTKKPHFQGYVHTDMSLQTFRNAVLREFPDLKSKTKGRSTGKYSCATVKKPDEYRAYCLKGTSSDLPDIMCGTLPIGYDVEAEHRKYWSKNAESVPKAVSIVARGVEYFEQNPIDPCLTFEEMRCVVCDWLTEQYRGAGKGIEGRMLNSWTNGILVTVSELYRQELNSQVAYRERRFW